MLESLLSFTTGVLMERVLICLILICGHFVCAQTDSSPAQATQPTLNPDPTLPPGATETTDTTALVEAPKDLPTRSLRALSQYTLNAHLSLLSTWLPGKYGASFGYISSDTWTIEAEITHKSYSAKLLDVDFGQIVDQRYGVQARYYPSSNSFNLIFGLFKSHFSFELGNSYLNNIPGSPSSTMWKFESLGPQLGLSNRYQWSNGFTLGVDWFVIYIPAFNKSTADSVLQSVTNAQDREDLDKTVKTIQNVPQFDLLRLTLGYTF